MLYVVSVVEGVLLYLFKEGGYLMPPRVDYKFVEILPRSFFHKGSTEGNIVVAVQTPSKKEEFQIGVKNLIDFFVAKKRMSREMGDDVLAINQLRNTFHLSKSREKISCGVEEVEQAFKILVDVLQRAPKILAKA